MAGDQGRRRYLVLQSAGFLPVLLRAGVVPVVRRVRRPGKSAAESARVVDVPGVGFVSVESGGSCAALREVPLDLLAGIEAAEAEVSAARAKLRTAVDEAWRRAPRLPVGRLPDASSVEK
jgi:hypothetical protein